MSVENELTLNPQQQFNQALIQMAVLLYQVDGKVTLTEQDYLDELIDSLDWQSPICREAFLTESIHTAREALSRDSAQDLLRSLQTPLNIAPQQALEVAIDITGVDGERSEAEAELLSLLTHKLLAKGLTQHVT